MQAYPKFYYHFRVPVLVVDCVAGYIFYQLWSWCSQCQCRPTAQTSTHQCFAMPHVGQEAPNREETVSVSTACVEITSQQEKAMDRFADVSSDGCRSIRWEQN